MADTLLRLSQVLAATGLSKASVYRLEQEGRFPKRVAISPGRVGWRESELAAWMDALPTPAPKNRPELIAS
jgi:prophage regulatory protein